MKILLANTSILTNKIGSWTTRFQKLIYNNPEYFDFILSPDINKELNVLTSKKRIFFSYRFSYNFQLLNWVAKDYINNLNYIVSKYPNEFLEIIVVDDLNLIKAVVLWKDTIKLKNIKLYFSFHGHYLRADIDLINKINKIFFLTHKGYLKTLNSYFSFTPEVSIVGNGVDSEFFYPLNQTDKLINRQKYNIPTNKKIIVWLANDRPSKGLHIFKQIVEKLNEKYKDLFFLIIGSKKIIDGDNIFNVGRLSNNEVANYLQLSDFYFHTALVQEGFGLTIVEAIKTGNIIISSNLGGISEVLAKFNDRSFLINYPNVVDEWVNKFDEVYAQKFPVLTKTEAQKIWNYHDWEDRFLKSLK